MLIGVEPEPPYGRVCHVMPSLDTRTFVTPDTSSRPSTLTVTCDDAVLAETPLIATVPLGRAPSTSRPPLTLKGVTASLATMLSRARSVPLDDSKMWLKGSVTERRT